MTSKDQARESSADPAGLRALVLFLTFDAEKRNAVRTLLSDHVRRWGPITFTAVEIDNADESAPWRTAPEGMWPCPAFLVGGDNAAHEFTGWDKGWRETQMHLGEAWDVVIVVNDALQNSKPVEALGAIDAALIAQLSGMNAVLGWVDTFARVSPDPIDSIFHPMIVFGQPVRKWVCTTFFIASAPLFRAVTPLTTVKDASCVFAGGTPAAPFAAGAPLSDNYRYFLAAHQARVWKRGDARGYALSDDTLPLFQRKARNIINEHALGARFWRAGAAHINLTTFDRRPRGLGLSLTPTPGAPRRQALRLRLLSLWQLAREIVPPAVAVWRRRLSRADSA